MDHKQISLSSVTRTTTRVVVGDEKFICKILNAQILMLHSVHQWNKCQTTEFSNP